MYGLFSLWYVPGCRNSINTIKEYYATWKNNKKDTPRISEKGPVPPRIAEAIGTESEVAPRLREKVPSPRFRKGANDPP